MNILLAGVGGQGIVLAGDLLAGAALYQGLDVKKSEIHGMSQRGGSVTSHVRFGEEIFSPVIPEGQVDLFIAFERLESLRYLSFLREGGRAIVNDQVILPATVLSGAASYPKEIEGFFRKKGLGIEIVDGPALAARAGNPLTLNMVLLGVASRYLALSHETWQAAISAGVKPRFLEVNLRAFELGRGWFDPLLRKIQ